MSEENGDDAIRPSPGLWRPGDVPFTKDAWMGLHRENNYWVVATGEAVLAIVFDRGDDAEPANAALMALAPRMLKLIESLLEGDERAEIAARELVSRFDIRRSGPSIFQYKEE